MTYYLDPFGCVKNQVDAETMMAFLNGRGWVSADDPSAADLIIINSCGFIESAKQESINAVLDYRRVYPGKKILLAGCLAQRYGRELGESLTEADLLFGNGDLSKITEAAKAALEGSPDKVFSPHVPADRTAGEGVPAGSRPLLSLPGSAYVKINEGCDNRCSFCSIPLIRGPLRSRPVPQVLAECRDLLNREIRELCLIGQDLGSYGRDLSAGNCLLPELLEALSGLEGRFWVRLLYIHPDNFPPAILETCRRDPRLLPYFDIPLQHGSAKILRAMNRRGNAPSYLGLIENIRTLLPDAVIRSTFLTGFPGETGEDFEALLDFQDRARLDWLGCFAYSREEDTPAYAMKERVPRKIAAERKAILEERQIPITGKRMDRFLGRELEALVEERLEAPESGEETGAPAGGMPGEDFYLGRLYCQAPEVDGAAVICPDRPLTPGTFVRGRVVSRAGFDLELRILSQS
jgi:ribosomal protein S12 methylthiotransferase